MALQYDCITNCLWEKGKIKMIAIGSRVSWVTGIGTVTEVFTESVTRTIDGVEVTCLGSKENPAYLITADDGTVTLRLKSEVRPETDTLQGEINGEETT